VYLIASVMALKQLRVIYSVRRKGAPSKASIGFFTPPEAVVRNAIKACHEKSTTQYNIKLTEGKQITLDVLVCRGNQKLGDVFLREAQAEQRKLIHVPNLCPCLGNKLSFNIYSIQICFARTCSQIFPLPQFKCHYSGWCNFLRVSPSLSTSIPCARSLAMSSEVGKKAHTPWKR